MKYLFKFKKLQCFLALIFSFTLMAQDGPQAFMVSAKNTIVPVVAYQRTVSQTGAGDNTAINDVSFTSDFGVIALPMTWGIGKTAFVTTFYGGYGTIHGEGAGGAFDAKGTGAMDPGVVMSIGLVNAPAMTLLELSQFKKKFQLWGVFGFTAPLGTYDSNELINTGINKWNFRTGVSMSYKFGKDPNKSNVIDFTPSVNMFTDNNDPFMGNKATQKALFVAEAHFSHFFNPKFYMSFDYRMQEGGRTFIDGVDQNNRISQYTIGTTAQYNPKNEFVFRLAYGYKISDAVNNAHGVLAALIYLIPSKSQKKELMEAIQKAQQ